MASIILYISLPVLLALSRLRLGRLKSSTSGLEIASFCFLVSWLPFKNALFKLAKAMICSLEGCFLMLSSMDGSNDWSLNWLSMFILLSRLGSKPLKTSCGLSLGREAGVLVGLEARFLMEKARLFPLGLAGFSVLMAVVVLVGCGSMGLIDLDWGFLVACLSLVLLLLDDLGLPLVDESESLWAAYLSLIGWLERLDGDWESARLRLSSFLAEF